MAVLRIDTTHIDDSWYKFSQTGATEREIPELQIIYTTDLADTHDDVITDNRFVRRGRQFKVGSPPENTGLYCKRWSLERIGEDANVATWRQTVTVSSIQPKEIGRNPNPLDRGVEFLERVSGFRKITTLIDHFNKPVVNRAGDRMSGFEVDIPTPIYRYEGNFALPPDWALNLDGAVNTKDKVLPVTYQQDDGSVQILENITLRAGTAKLRITRLPLQPSVENDVKFFPIAWEYQESPIGWSEPLLNQGFTEKVYVDSNGDKVGTAAIVAGTFDSVQKRHILDDNGEPVREKQMLDWFGRKLQIPALSNQPQGTVDTEAGSTSIQNVDLPLDEDWIGQYIKVLPSDWSAKWQFLTTITEVDTSSGGSLTVTDPAPFTWEGADVYLPGISAINFAAVPYLDLTAVPVN